MYVVNEENFEKVLADVTPISKQLFEQSLGGSFVFQRFTVVRVSWCECPLYYFSAVVDDDVQLESEEPAHRALALGRPSPHCPMATGLLDVTGDNRRGVDDGYT